MPQNVVSYDSAQAGTSSTGLQGTISACETSMTDLNNFVHRVSANWEGDESLTAQSIQKQWDTSFAVVQGILKDIKSGLDKNTEMVGSMRGNVGRALGGGAGH